MLKIIGTQPPNSLSALQLGGVCPHCKIGTRFSLATQPNPILFRDKATEVVVGYLCDSCIKGIPVRWKIQGFDNQTNPIVQSPELILPVREPFDFDHVPPKVKKEISEGLDCLSVGAYNGFAGLCRRTIQAICTIMGAESSTKVQAQIEEMANAAGLDDETERIAIEIMLAGHDGSHPHLPDVNSDRAAILLELVRDIVYQMFTRPGRIRQSAELRKAAIAARK